MRVKPGELKKRLTQELSTQLNEFVGKDFDYFATREKVLAFLVSSGIHKDMLPEVDIELAKDGFVDIKVHDYPELSRWS